ncbi:MAG: hypothetical protein WCP96_16640 [Methylococcaceae bacterium]
MKLVEFRHLKNYVFILTFENGETKETDLKKLLEKYERLDTEFLAKSLQGAVKYFRIAGYFRSSIFELVGEEIAKIPEVKIVCNSELDLVDFLVASDRNRALKER